MKQINRTNFLALILGTFVVLSFAACGTTVKRVDADSQLDLSGNWNDTDVRLVCDTLIKSCLESPSVTEFIADYKAAHDKQRPTVIVRPFRNTSSEHIDTSIISSMMQTAIINSGKLDFVADASLRNEINDERDYQQSGYVDDAQAVQLGKETGAAFMLTGTVRSIVDTVEGKSVRSYFVDAQLINIETSRIVWQGQNSDIKKLVKRPKYKL
ncbi:MAG: penicillin-binding protein activator LpoB [Spirochaetaceae bacterium]|jgi:uncharacterized protein (TIGR02722 family)|nr:penicillin-binding protein activator LpoB [Spirochaetaceae bacterium]